MNANETSVRDVLSTEWSVYRNGWPDFLCIRRGCGYNRHVMCVEVKTNKDKVSPTQRIIHDTLNDIGIPVHIVRPNIVIDVKTFRSFLYSHNLENEIHQLCLENFGLRELLRVNNVVF